LVAECALSEIAGDQQAATAAGFDDSLGFFGIPAFGGEKDDRDIGPLAGIQVGDGASDPAVAAGDQGDFILKFSRGAIPRRGKFRAGIIRITLDSRARRCPRKRS
jgi:hypothetical protein